MSSQDGAIAALIASARDFTAAGHRDFGYVEQRDVAIATYSDALITRRDYLDGPMKFTGAVYDATGQLVRSSLGFSEGDFEPLDPAFQPPERAAAAHRMTRAVYGGTLYFVLGHFLFETVARLWHGVDFAARRRIGRGGLPVIFHPWSGLDLDGFFKNRLYRKTLSALGITRDDIVLANIDLSVETLYYPTPLSIYHVTLHPMMSMVIDHLVHELRTRPAPLAGLVRRATPRVFLSRSRWNANRRVRNETALEDLFETHGFTIVHPQRLSPAELIETLQNAEIVASTDGSQAHLMAFCRPGTRTLLIDTRPVPTQFAIEKLRMLRGLHIPVCTNGMWDPDDGAIDLSEQTDRLLAAVLAPDFEVRG
jgi:hypothetical protein